MTEPPAELEIPPDLSFARDHGFFDSSLAVRWGLGLLFSLFLMFFLHFREVRVEVLELNSIAPSYIVAQLDFDFFDEEATIILKQEAVRDIGKVYMLSEKSVRQRRFDFENYLIYDNDWRKNISNSTFEELYAAVDNLEKFLVQLRLTDPRTLQKMRELGLPTTFYQVYTPANLEDPVVLPPQIWNFVKEHTMPKQIFLDETADFVIKYFQDKQWAIEEDIPTQRLMRKLIQSEVPDKLTHVSAGSRIIDQGEKVTTRHIAMLQAMKNALRDQRNLWHPMTLLGSLILTVLLVWVSVIYVKNNHLPIFDSNRKLALLLAIVVMTLIFAKSTEYFLFTSKSTLMDIVQYPVFVPFASILLCSLMNAEIATFATAFITLVLTCALAFERQGFLLMNLAAAVVAILNTRSLRKRKEIFVVCAKAWLCCVAVIFAIHSYQNTLWNITLFTDMAVAATFLIIIAVLVVGLLPLLESIFKVMTDVTLMEYMDPNNNLLRRLSIEAPGTYQHSIVVGNLAEAAALSIGANGLFCRVATMYHDIGKMATPQYFTENQQSGMNIHQLLTPRESAQVIIAHVSEGVAMARKVGLPEQFIDIIKEHHGTTLVYYFYRKELERVGNDTSKVDEREFRYSGPTPRTKESAIIMISDSMEAASRSLEQISETTLMELANRLIREKTEDGQFDHAVLTFSELATVKSTLVKTLVAYGHARVKYPMREDKKAADLVPLPPSDEA